MSLDAYRDASMLELFQMEAKTQTDVLNEGLLALERDPLSAVHLEACMRAAHSLKGAARIVNLTPAVPVAHAMEDCLVLAQSGQLRLTPAHIDVLLAGTDMLVQIGAPLGPDGQPGVTDDAIERYVARVEAVIKGEPADSVETPPPQDLPVVETAPAPAVATVIDAAAPVPAQVRAPGERTGLLSDPADSPTARVLRVTADTLNRLLGLSSEALVETRWLSPFSKSLLQLKRQHDATVSGLDALYAQLQATNADPVALGLLGELRIRASATQTSMTARVNELNNFDWRIGHLTQRLYDTALACRMRPLADAMSGMARMVRDLGRELGKTVRLEIVGQTTKVDRDILEKLDAPLSHILRNAVDHGIEPPHVRLARGKPEEGVITIDARHSAGLLVIEISDDGAGVDIEGLRKEVHHRGLTSLSTANHLSERELLEFLFLPGFSTRNTVTEVSGRGVGLDAVQDTMRALRGSASIARGTHSGTRFTLELPLSLSVVRALLVEVCGEPYALPLAFIVHTLMLPRSAIIQLEGHQHFEFQGRQIGLVSARQLLNPGQEGVLQDESLAVIVLGEGEWAVGMAVDRYLGERSLVVQPLDPRLGKVQDIACGALMEDGSPVLVLDVEDLSQSIQKLITAGRLSRLGRSTAETSVSHRKRVLVVDDSLTVRELERKLLTKRGYEVAVAVDGMDGWNMLRAEAFDMVISDIDMPRMDGIELVTMMKKDPQLAGIPVMIVSYKDRPEDRERGLEAGADYYLAKGNFHDETLLSIVEDLIGGART